MTPNDKNNARNEFYIPKSVTLDVSHVHIHVRNKRVEFCNMADGGHIGFGHSVIRGVIPEEHLGDFSCLGTH